MFNGVRRMTDLFSTVDASVRRRQRRKGPLNQLPDINNGSRFLPICVTPEAPGSKEALFTFVDRAQIAKRRGDENIWLLKVLRAKVKAEKQRQGSQAFSHALITLGPAEALRMTGTTVKLSVTRLSSVVAADGNGRGSFRAQCSSQATGRMINLAHAAGATATAGEKELAAEDALAIRRLLSRDNGTKLRGLLYKHGTGFGNSAVPGTYELVEIATDELWANKTCGCKACVPPPALAGEGGAVATAAASGAASLTSWTTVDAAGEETYRTSCSNLAELKQLALDEGRKSVPTQVGRAGVGVAGSLQLKVKKLNQSTYGDLGVATIVSAMRLGSAMAPVNALSPAGVSGLHSEMQLQARVGVRESESNSLNRQTFVFCACLYNRSM
jgi:hypothetical protein